ncbi:MAG: MarR family transcriptional regulator [Rubrivivax sp.]|nr:MarR family transcriptional regulator [Rubrivivax sp.]MCL4696478.1 MarR family transcriptional regulator [Burkholderiaceae bacterium]
MTNKTSKKTLGPARVSLAQLRSIKPEELITYRVALLSHLIGQVVERSVSQPLELTSRQWRVMMLLNRSGPSTSGQIAANSPLDHSQVSRVSYELADKGLISMHADPHDRRKLSLALTPAGTDLLRQGLVESMKRQQRFRDCLVQEDFAAFDRALDTLIAEARRMLAEHQSAD